MKSSLKTFLAGKNPYVDQQAVLKNAVCLTAVISVFEGLIEKGLFWTDEGVWYIDALDDGTAITYCLTA